MIDAWLGRDERLEEVIMGGEKQEWGWWYFLGYEHSVRN